MEEDRNNPTHPYRNAIDRLLYAMPIDDLRVLILDSNCIVRTRATIVLIDRVAEMDYEENDD